MHWLKALYNLTLYITIKTKQEGDMVGWGWGAKKKGIHPSGKSVVWLTISYMKTLIKNKIIHGTDSMINQFTIFDTHTHTHTHTHTQLVS